MRLGVCIYGDNVNSGHVIFENVGNIDFKGIIAAIIMLHNMTVYIYIALSRNSLEIKGNSLALVLLCYFKIFSVPRVFVFNVSARIVTTAIRRFFYHIIVRQVNRFPAVAAQFPAVIVRIAFIVVKSCGRTPFFRLAL